MIGDGIMSDLVRMRLYWRNQCWKEHSVLYDVTVTVLKEWIPMQEDSEQLWWLYNRYYVFGQSINYCTKGIRHYFPQTCENVTEKEVRNKLEMLNKCYTYLVTLGQPVQNRRYRNGSSF